jgi:hypothetical protein
MGKMLLYFFAAQDNFRILNLLILPRVPLLCLQIDFGLNFLLVRFYVGVP